MTQHVFARSMVNIADTAVPVLARGKEAWFFADGHPVKVPRFLLSVPRVLAWLMRNHVRQKPSNTLAVTAIPQMGCNAACGYCIQNISISPKGVERVSPEWMRDSVMDSVVGFIERQRVAQGLDGVMLEIFGGEPLLNPERCYRLLEKIKHLHGASITTNGTLLTPKIAQRLNDGGVSSVQITFDGGRTEHDSIRVLAAGGKGTYDTIVRNLAAIDQLTVLPSR